MPSNMITTFKAGETITIAIDETVTHPGHYRVALAEEDMMDLPAPPEVTKGSTACGSAAIMDPPVYPVLADGELQHEKAFSGPQSFMVKLPDDVTCEKCVLQVIEFMSNHGLNNPGGCFYHHCANIKITADGAGGSGGGGGAAGGNSSKGGSGGVPASGGAGGGAGGAGGTAAGAGGRGGQSGGATGGSTPTGGTASPATGGAPTGGTTSTPPAPLTGGAPATATGGAPAGGSTPVIPPPAPAAASSDDSGGCSLGARPGGSAVAAWAAALAGVALMRRRHRRSAGQRQEQRAHRR